MTAANVIFMGDIKSVNCKVQDVKSTALPASEKVRRATNYVATAFMCLLEGGCSRHWRRVYHNLSDSELFVFIGGAAYTIARSDLGV